MCVSVLLCVSMSEWIMSLVCFPALRRGVVGGLALSSVCYVTDFPFVFLLLLATQAPQLPPWCLAEGA